jgi:hypothetical protein
MMANKWHLFGVYAVEEGIIVSKQVEMYSKKDMQNG